MKNRNTLNLRSVLNLLLVTVLLATLVGVASCKKKPPQSAPAVFDPAIDGIAVSTFAKLDYDHAMRIKRGDTLGNYDDEELVLEDEPKEALESPSGTLPITSDDSGSTYLDTYEEEEDEEPEMDLDDPNFF